MSLTSHIKNKASPVRLWLETQFGNLSEALATFRANLPSDLAARTIRPAEGLPDSTLGMAIDYRVRYHLGATLSEDLVAAAGAAILLERHLNESDPENPALWRETGSGSGIRVSGHPRLTDPGVAHLAPAALFGTLDRLLADTQPAGRTLDTASEDRLDRACVVLALYEEVFRTQRLWPTSPLASIPIDASANAVLGSIPPSWAEDVGTVCRRLFAEVPLTGKAVLNPGFALGAALGGADADFVLDRCLIDIKATVNPRLDSLWLLQLLGYVLLDSEDAYHLDAVGVLLARQAVMVRWPLEDLLDVAAGPGRRPLATMRADFARLVSTSRSPRIIRVGAPRLTVGGSVPIADPKRSSPSADVIGLTEAAELTGRSRTAIRRAIADGRLAAVPPRSRNPAGVGSGYRLQRTEVQALFPPRPAPEPHLCGRECVEPIHVSYVAAQIADPQSAEAYLRHAHGAEALMVKACTPCDRPVDGLPRMAVEKYVGFGSAVIPAGSPWRSWRVSWWRR